VNWLDLLLSRLDSGDGVFSEIFSLDSTRSGSISVRPVAAKLDWIICDLNASVRARGYSARKSSLSMWL
jgi:hypothetical protein